MSIIKIIDIASLIFFVLIFFFLVLSTCDDKKCKKKGVLHTGIHKKNIDRAFWLTLLTIVLVETSIRLIGGLSHDYMVTTHLLFSIPFLVLLSVVKFWLPKSKKDYKHPILHIVLVLYIGSFITGAIMLSGVILG